MIMRPEGSADRMEKLVDQSSVMGSLNFRNSPDSAPTDLKKSLICSYCFPSPYSSVSSSSSSSCFFGPHPRINEEDGSDDSHVPDSRQRPNEEA